MVILEPYVKLLLIKLVKLQRQSFSIFVNNIGINNISLLRGLQNRNSLEREASHIYKQSQLKRSLANIYQSRSGFGVTAVEGGRIGKIIDGCSPVKVRRNATSLLVSFSVSVNPSWYSDMMLTASLKSQVLAS